MQSQSAQMELSSLNLGRFFSLDPVQIKNYTLSTNVQLQQSSEILYRMFITLRVHYNPQFRVLSLHSIMFTVDNSCSLSECIVFTSNLRGLAQCQVTATLSVCLHHTLRSGFRANEVISRYTGSDNAELIWQRGSPLWRMEWPFIELIFCFHVHFNIRVIKGQKGEKDSKWGQF